MKRFVLLALLLGGCSAENQEALLGAVVGAGLGAATGGGGDAAWRGAAIGSGAITGNDAIQLINSDRADALGTALDILNHNRQ